MSLDKPIDPVFTRPFSTDIVREISYYCVGRRYTALGELVDVSDEILLLLLAEQRYAIDMVLPTARFASPAP